MKCIGNKNFHNLCEIMKIFVKLNDNFVQKNPTPHKMYFY